MHFLSAQTSLAIQWMAVLQAFSSDLFRQQAIYCHLLNVVLFFAPLCYYSRQDPRRSAIFKILKLCLAPTTMAKSLRSDSDANILCKLRHLTCSYSTWLLHCTATTWLADWIITWLTKCTGVPIKVLSKWYMHLSVPTEKSNLLSSLQSEKCI